MKKNFLIISGGIIPAHPFYKVFNFNNCKFIGFYFVKKFDKESIEKNKIIFFKEKYKCSLLWPFKIICRTYKIMKQINKQKPVYIITHHDDANISILLTLFICKFLLKRKIKFIAYIHNGNIYQQDNFLLKIIIPFMIKKIYKYFDKIITVSNGNKFMLETKFNLKNIEVIYNPIDLKKSLNLSKKPLEKKYEKLFNNNSFKFITIGRFSFEKNLFNILNIFSNLKQYDVKLFIIGSGKLKIDLEKNIIKLNLEKNIFIIDFQDNIFNFIKNCDCFILNSYYESFGQVLVEALIFNKIVISTDCGGPREILSPELNIFDKIKYPYFGKYGILTKPYNLNQKNKESNLILEKLLKDIIKNKKKYLINYSNTLVRAKDFNIKNIQKNLLEKLK